MRHLWQSMNMDEKRLRVSALAHQSMSASQIAEKLGAPSRSAVIGFCHREKIPLSGSKGRTFTDAKKKKTTNNVVSIKQAKPRKKEAKPDAKPADVVLLWPAVKKEDVRQIDGPINMIEMPLMGRCRSPLNDDYRGMNPAQMMFCGEVTEPDSSWCHECQKKFVTGRGSVLKASQEKGGTSKDSPRKRRPFQRWLR